MDIADLLALSVSQGASDLHLSAGVAPMLRIDGELFCDVEEFPTDAVLFTFEYVGGDRIDVVGAEHSFLFTTQFCSRS